MKILICDSLEKEVINIFNEIGATANEIASLQESHFSILSNDECILREPIRSLEHYWRETSHSIQRLRDNPETSDSEINLLDNKDYKGLTSNTVFDDSKVKRINIKPAKQISFFIMIIFLSGNLFADNKIQNNEDRVTDISLQIRCMVCQSQTIDDSDAPLAKDLKQLVRKMVYEGKSNDEIFDFLRSKYGDYILMKPRFNLSNILLWFGPFFIFILGIFAVLKVFKINFRPN